MERLEVKAEVREIGKGSSRKLRREGSVPAILYGVGREPAALYVNRREMDKAVSTHAAWNILIDLMIGGKDKVVTRISDYQADVLTRELTHLDFQAIDLTKKIRTEVPIRIIGKALGVVNGGVIEVAARKVSVRCLPTNIPEQIDVDVTPLDIGANIHVNELILPEGIECIHETNFSIVSVVAPTEELVAEIAATGEPVVEGEVPVEGAAPAAEGAAPAAAAAPAAKEGEKK